MIRVVLFSARLGSKAGHVIGRALDVMFGALTWAEPVRGAALVWSQPSRAARHVPNKPSTITLVRLTQPNRSATHVTSVRLKTGTSFRPRTREKPSPALGRVHEHSRETHIQHYLPVRSRTTNRNPVPPGQPLPPCFVKCPKKLN